VEGRLQTNSWDDATAGVKKYRTEVIVDSFQMVGPKPREEVAA
jgi:single-stranded DNA-binding protein